MSANHKVVDSSVYPHYLGQVFKAGYRAEAIHRELDKLQARTLHSKPFGHRCARGSFDPGKSGNELDEGEEGAAEEAA